MTPHSGGTRLLGTQATLCMPNSSASTLEESAFKNHVHSRTGLYSAV